MAKCKALTGSAVKELSVLMCVCLCQIEHARLVQQYCDKAETCLAKRDYRTVCN